MKKLYILFALITFCMLSVSAQNGYYYGDKFIELTPKPNVSPYVMPSKSLVNQQGIAIQNANLPHWFIRQLMEENQ